MSTTFMTKVAGEKASRMSLNLYNDILTNFPIAFALLYGDGDILFANSRFLAFCRPHCDIRGRHIREILPFSNLQTLLRSCLKQQQTQRGEFPFITAQDSIAMVQVTVTPLPLSSSSSLLSPALLVLEDISEKVRWEEQLLQVEKLSGMAELAATVAHELGNPLGIICSTLQYMQTHLQGNQFHDELTVILDQVERMHELLRTLMDVTGPAESRMGYEQVDRIFAQVLTFIAKEAERRSVQIKTNFTPALPFCLIDARQLKQVFLNLCKNALEAMPTGGTLTVGVYPSPEEKGVVIEVTDTGVGIPPEDLDRIWKPFYSTKASGRGLGLSLCRRVIEQQGGRIRVHRLYGQGTTFCIILPASHK